MRRRAKTIIARTPRTGFALPSVLIASVVMLTVLTVAVSTTTAIRNDLMTQYYTQLSQTAAEAGIAQAVACLQANGDKPTWNAANPLTPQTNCSGTVVSGYPTFLVSAHGIQSSYRVGLPATDASGMATTLSATGFVQLLRTSTGAVWRTYSATVTRPSASPTQCSSGAVASSGWSPAYQTGYAGATTVSNSQAISPGSAANLNPGPIYYRDAFYVKTAGPYTVTMAVDDYGTVYIDGSSVLSSSSAGLRVTGSVNLSQGCHVISVNATNDGISPNPSYLSLTITSPSFSEPIEATSTSWETVVGPTDQYSSIGYWMSGTQWTPVYDFGSVTVSTDPWSGQNLNAWLSAGGDRFANWIVTPASRSGSNYPSAAYSYYRNPNGFYLSSPAAVKMIIDCDDQCNLYVDGNATPLVSDTAGWGSAVTASVSLAAGWHDVGVALHNMGTAPNPSAFLFDAYNGSTLLMRSDTSWEGTTAWTGNLAQYYSYDAIYTPTPSQTKGIAYGQLFVVAGGGGGAWNAAGGGGGGGVIDYGNAPTGSGAQWHSGYQLTPGTYTVTVGAGAANTGGIGRFGGNGSNSSFGTISATGGGGGAPRDANIAPGVGGSGGGGSGAYNGWTNNVGAAPVSGQGNYGGNGTPSDASVNATGGGGGGAGGPGGSGVPGGASGDGGAGYISYMTGVPVIYGAGGAGSVTVYGTDGRADSGGGADGQPTTANHGGGGGALGTTGGDQAGGSGVVIISFPVGSISASATGAYTVSTATTAFGGASTVYTFTGNGTFTISSVNI